jgi:hypothetical protein
MSGIGATLVIAGCSGECRFTQPIAAAQAWRPERVFMPLRDLGGARSRTDDGVDGPDGERKLPAAADTGGTLPPFKVSAFSVLRFDNLSTTGLRPQTQ